MKKFDLVVPLNSCPDLKSVLKEHSFLYKDFPLNDVYSLNTAPTTLENILTLVKTGFTELISEDYIYSFDAKK